MSPAVSLIMPAWRPRPEWLREAVTSALDEPDCAVELLVVDDGSDEPVAPLLADLDDSRVRVMRVEHGGPYAARNAGMAEARGEFVRFLDADDVVVAGSTGRLLDLARRGEHRTAYGATLMCDQSLRPLETFTSDLEGDAAEACVLGGFEVFVVSLLFPRAVIDRAGPWEETAFQVSGDWDFVLRALEEGPVRRLDEVVTHYRRHDSSITKNADVAAGARAGKLVLDRHFERNPENRGGDLERRAYLRLHMDRASAHAWAGQRRLAVRQLALAARRDPGTALSAAARAAWTRVSRWAPRRARRSPRPPA